MLIASCSSGEPSGTSPYSLPAGPSWQMSQSPRGGPNKPRHTPWTAMPVWAHARPLFMRENMLGHRRPEDHLIVARNAATRSRAVCGNEAVRRRCQWRTDGGHLIAWARKRYRSCGALMAPPLLIPTTVCNSRDASRSSLRRSG